jgi:hypothetical protein
MFYSTNQSYHWKLNQSEVDISGRLANQIVRIDFIFIMRVQMIWKIWKKSKLNSEEMENTEEK